ncbi:MAG: hypothetical protein ACYS83_07840 [Planctomycetota bacterium]|jgi:hypothetical protein
MEHFQGKILDNDQVVLENVEGVLYNDPNSTGWTNCTSSFNAPNYKSVSIEQEYILELDDGPSMKIFISQGPSSLQKPYTVQFQAMSYPERNA